MQFAVFNPSSQIENGITHPDMHIETYHTNRLLLRKFTPELYKHIFTNHTEPEIKEIIGFGSEEAFQRLKKRFGNGPASFNPSLVAFQLRDKDTNEVIGGCGLHNWFLEHRRAEIGYSIDNEKFKQRGLMKEAVAFVIDYGFREMDLHRIEALVGPNNIPSLKLIRNSGFREEGYLREHYFVNGAFSDSLIFGLLRQITVVNVFAVHFRVNNS